MSTFLQQTLLILLLLLFPIFLYKFLFPKTNKTKLPPSPPKLPIIGNLHQLGKLPHRSLHNLSLKYGDLMLLHLGSKPVLIVSSAKAAHEITKTHDLIFANRPKLHVTTKLFYDGRDIAFGPYTTYWRHVRSITVLHFLSPKRVQSFRAIREEEVISMVENIRLHGCHTSFNIGEVLITLVKDGVCRASLGKKYETDFDGLFKEFTQVTGLISVADYVPWLGWIDRVTGLQGRTEKLGNDFDEFLERIVGDRLNNASGVDNNNKEKEDVEHFLDVLVQVHKENPTNLPLESIKALLLDVFAGAIETSYTLLEWAMTELIRHPRVMKLLREDIVKNIKDKTRVTENDLENMKYLKAVIKETLRVHPPVCLLPFREASDNAKLNGYEFSAGTQVLINAWAIQRDPRYWEDSDEFKPERFLNSTGFDFKGQNTNYIPFGAGRRGCPGILYGLATSELALATLIYEFDWKLPDGSVLDVEESHGITVRRKHPLMLIATSYNS